MDCPTELGYSEPMLRTEKKLKLIILGSFLFSSLFLVGCGDTSVSTLIPDETDVLNTGVDADTNEDAGENIGEPYENSSGEIRASRTETNSERYEA